MDCLNGSVNYICFLLIVVSTVIGPCSPAVIDTSILDLKDGSSNSHEEKTPSAGSAVYEAVPAEETADRSGHNHRMSPQGTGLGALFPPNSLLTVSNNPLRDQPNLSTGRGSIGDQIIYGSKKAFTVTKLEYLKKEWCKTEPLKQVIREEGCLQRTVVNRFCYGQCNSFFIPKSNKKDLESAAFKSCSFCKPKRYSWITVTLRCPSKKPRFKRKRIQMIKQCKCMAQKLD